MGELPLLERAEADIARMIEIGDPEMPVETMRALVEEVEVLRRENFRMTDQRRRAHENLVMDIESDGRSAMEAIEILEER